MLLAIAFAAAPVAVSAAPGDGTSAALPASAASAAQDIYNYLKSRPAATTSNGVIAGQHLGGFNDLPPAPSPTFGIVNHFVLDAQNQKRYPGFVGARYDATDKLADADSGNYVLDPVKDHRINVALISDWLTYHPIIALTATPPNPWDATAGRGPSSSDTRLADLLHANQGHPGNANFWNSIKIIGDGIEELKNQGIPVVLRPFAEFNVSKYYGPDGTYKDATGVQTHQSAADFTALWADVYNYYVNTRKLNNLIFCWEAWVIGRNGPQSDVAPWFPDASTVDIVSGAYYFPSGGNNGLPYFGEAPGYALTLQDYKGTKNGPPPSLDATTQANLIAVADANNKPFGVAQWGENYVNGQNCSTPGNANHASGFYNSVKSTVAPYRDRTTFIYFWVQDCAVEQQAYASTYVSSAPVATADDIAHVVAIRAGVDGNAGGWVLESAQKSGVGGSIQNAIGSLRTGDSAANLRYRSILTFNTSGIPAGATITSISLRMHSSGTTTSNGNDPFTLFAPFTVDVAGPNGFANTAGLSPLDFKPNASTDILGVGTLSNPASDNLSWSQAALSGPPFTWLNRAGVTQLRVLSSSPSNLDKADNYLSWFSGDASTATNLTDRPQLVVSYHD